VTLANSNGAPTSLSAGVEAPSENSEKSTTGDILRGRVIFRQLWTREAPTEEWTLKPLVPKGRQVALWSPAKEGKSLLALDGVAAAATGRPVFGQPPGSPITVIYFDQEQTVDDLHARLIDMGYGPDTDLDAHLVYYLLSDLPALDTEKGGQVVEELVRLHGADLAVLDTMARIVRGKENDNDTYRDFYRCTGLRLKTLGCSLLRLDHAGKDASAGQRGASAKDDDVDVVFKLSYSGHQVTVHRTHSRVPWVRENYVFNRELDPLLAHILTGDQWTDAAKNIAGLLNAAVVPLDATRDQAQMALKAQDAKHRGRRGIDIDNALAYRREVARKTAPETRQQGMF
jgi:hypothetical protein